MDTKTNEVFFNFRNEEELRKSLGENPTLREVNCNSFCQFLVTIKDGRTFCRANRKQRREMKCFIKRADTKVANGTDCKSVVDGFGGSSPPLPTKQRR